MSQRITEKHLAFLVERINTVTGNPLKSWVQVTEQSGKIRNVAQVGNYHLDWAYGGVQLVQMCTAGGGISTVTGLGTKRACYDQLQAFLRGVESRAVSA